MILALGGCRFWCSGGRMGRVDLAGAARLELVSGVAQLRPEDAMLEAMLSGWRGQQAARGLREDTVVLRERLGGRVGEVAGGDPGGWAPGDLDGGAVRPPGGGGRGGGGPRGAGGGRGRGGGGGGRRRRGGRGARGRAPPPPPPGVGGEV